MGNGMGRVYLRGKIILQHDSPLSRLSQHIISARLRAATGQCLRQFFRQKVPNRGKWRTFTVRPSLLNHQNGFILDNIDYGHCDIDTRTTRMGT
jgi:hypothetical protein